MNENLEDSKEEMVEILDDLKEEIGINFFYFFYRLAFF